MRIAVKQVNAGLGVVQWGLAVGAICLIVDTIALRPPLQRPQLTSADGVAASSAQATQSGPSLNSLKSIWQRDLRQTLIKPPPVARPKPKAPPPPPPVHLPKLRATFVERARSWGIFVDQRGRVRVRAAGGRIDDFEIVSINADIARLRRGGDTHEVAVPKAMGEPTRRSNRKRGR